MDQTRKVGGALALGAALLLCIGLFTKGWFTASEKHDSVGVGLTGIEICEGSDCESASFSKIKEDTWGLFGTLTLIAGLAGTATLVFAGGSLLAGKTPTIKATLLRIPLALTTGCATGFIIAKPSKAGDISIGYSMFMTYGAIALGMWALQMFAKAQQQTGPTPLPVAQAMPGVMPQGMPAAPQQAPCPRCAGGMTWVGEYQRWYCTRCQQYA